MTDQLLQCNISYLTIRETYSHQDKNKDDNFGQFNEPDNENTLSITSMRVLHIKDEQVITQKIREQ